MENILPAYLAMGISAELFWDSTPFDLKPYVKAYEKQRELMDYDAWKSGLYFQRAVYCAISDAFNGKDSKAEYFDKPLSQFPTQAEKADKPKEDKELNTVDLEAQRDLAIMMIRQANYNISQIGKQDEQEG